MSSNVASSSTAVFINPSSYLPTVDEVKGWNVKQINEFLEGRRNDIGNHVDTLKAQELDGSTFLDLKRGDLLDIQIPLGLAKKIVKLVKDIQESKRTLFSLQ